MLDPRPLGNVFHRMPTRIENDREILDFSDDYTIPQSILPSCSKVLGLIVGRLFFLNGQSTSETHKPNTLMAGMCRRQLRQASRCKKVQVLVEARRPVLECALAVRVRLTRMMAERSSNG